MPQTSLKQKLLLILLGIFLTLISLEIGLRIAGSIVFYLQERHNHLSFDNHEYRILCLGESTTALGGEDSYPSLLEDALNAQDRQQKFTVINEGVISTTTAYILAHVDQNLDLYKPQLVIVMMGINDRFYLHEYKKWWWQNMKFYVEDLRVCKLVNLLYEHITHRLQEIRNPTASVALPQEIDNHHQMMEDFLKYVISSSMDQFHAHISNALHYHQEGQEQQASQEKELAARSIFDASSAYIQLAQRCRLQGSYQEAEELMEKASILAPGHPDLYREWGELYLVQDKIPEAIKAFQEALNMDPKDSDSLLGLARSYYKAQNNAAFLFFAGYLQIKPDDYWANVEFAQWLNKSKQYEGAQKYLNHAIELAPYIDQAYIDSGEILDEQDKKPQEEAFYLREIKLHPKMPRLYQSLGEFYQREGKNVLAKIYFQKATQPQVSEYYPATLINYDLLLTKILNRHIKVAVMQYPLRDITPLRNYLGQRPGMFYVENRQNFRQALDREGYRYYFKDNFGNDFGHCTRAGNELIARHLTDIILTKILPSY